MRVIRKVLDRGRFFAVLLFQRFWSVGHVECAVGQYFSSVNISTTDVWRQCRLSFRVSLHIASEVAIVLQARSAARPQGSQNNFSFQNSGIPRIFPPPPCSHVTRYCIACAATSLAAICRVYDHLLLSLVVFQRFRSPKSSSPRSRRSPDGRVSDNFPTRCPRAV
jgi:hypothetical protein